jgi:hypothetical protein
MRIKFTLSIQEELREKMKIQAVRERRDVSDITEELYRDYLERQRQTAKAAWGKNRKRVKSEDKAT